MRKAAPYLICTSLALALAGCVGGDDSPSLAEIRAQTGLAVPIEAPENQNARAPAIVSRADSLILSSMPGETDHPDIPTFRARTQCSGAVCEVSLLGGSRRIRVSDLTLADGTARAIGTRHGITLVQGSSRITGAYVTGLGAWMNHSAFAVQAEGGIASGTRFDFRYGIAAGDLTARPLTGSATWRGIMVGTPVAGDRRGENLVGRASLSYELDDGTVDVGFSRIQNIDRGEAHATGMITFRDVALSPNGTFQAGLTGNRIQGGFYGPDHAEAAGIFERANIVGAFGATRQ